MTLGDAIRSRREAAGISQESLAEAVGLTQTEVSKIERNERTPRFALVAKIASTLKVSLDQLAAETEAANASA